MTNTNRVMQVMQAMQAKGLTNVLNDVDKTEKAKTKKVKTKATPAVTAAEIERRQILEQQEIAEENMLEFGGKKYRKIEGLHDLEGVERLVRKYNARWNGERLKNQKTGEEMQNSYLTLNYHEREEAEQAVRLAILSRPILPTHEKLPEGMRDYFGISTWRQYWDGYNAFKSPLKRKETTARGELDIDSWMAQAHPKNHIEEAEYDLFLQQVLGDLYPIFHMRFEQGYTQKAIAKELGIGKNVMTRRIQASLEIIKIVLNVDDNGDPIENAENTEGGEEK